MFPASADYLDVYERFDLISRRSVLAHNVHTTDSQLDRLARAGASVAHCPSSNAALGSGIFPMRRHLERHVRVALGTDVGAGAGSACQRNPPGVPACSAWRRTDDSESRADAVSVTSAGAEALNIEDNTGDFTPGKSADFICLRPMSVQSRGAKASALPPSFGSASADVDARPEGRGPDGSLGHLRLPEVLTLANQHWIREVYVEGDLIHDHG